MSSSVGSRLHVALGIWLAICLVVVFCKKTEVSYGDYLEMKNYLEYINRPAVTTIETEDGDIFDCVDKNKQPALDHPALRNHVIQMEPASIPDGMNVKPESYIAMKTGLPDGGCPVGTVPIRRVQMEQLLRAGSVSNLMNKYGKRGNSSNQLKTSDVHLYAVTRLTGGSYNGTLVSISVWNPPVKNDETFSLAQIWFVNGERGPTRNTIEFGWQVYPDLYGDSDPHLFIFWTADNYESIGCYNLMCPGFIQESRTITPGMKLSKISQLNGNQVYITLQLFWDVANLRWYLAYSDTPSGPFEIVGYWPSSRFTTLGRGSSNRIEWGGETIGKAGSTFPPMGSGQFPDQGYGKAACMKQMKYLDSSGKAHNVPDNLGVLQTQPDCYKLENKGFGSAEFGRHLFFGGPGGSCA